MPFLKSTFAIKCVCVRSPHGQLLIPHQYPSILFKAVSFTLLSALGHTLKRKLCKLDRERWDGIQMKELVKERIYKDFTAVLEIFHDQNRILKKATLSFSPFL